MISLTDLQQNSKASITSICKLKHKRHKLNRLAAAVVSRMMIMEPFNKIIKQ